MVVGWWIGDGAQIIVVGQQYNNSGRAVDQRW